MKKWINGTYYWFPKANDVGMEIMRCWVKTKPGFPVNIPIKKRSQLVRVKKRNFFIFVRRNIYVWDWSLMGYHTLEWMENQNFISKKSAKHLKLLSFMRL